MPAPVEPTMASLVAAGSLCLAAGGLYGWGGLTLALADKFNLGSAQIDEVFSVAMFAFSGAILLSARLPPPLRGLLAATAAGWLGASATLLAAMAPGYPDFLMCYGLGFGAARGTIYNASLEMASESSSSGGAMPAMVAHFGLGGAVFDAGTRALVAEGPGLWSIWPVTLALAFASAFGSVVHWQTPHTKRGESLSTTASSATASLAPFQIAGLWLLFALGAMSGLMYLALARTILADLSSGPGLASFAVFAIAIANMPGAWRQLGFSAPSQPRSSLFRVIRCASSP